MTAAPAPIRRLDTLTASRIAAGEVVERPASVVKELVENSIDAAARDIRVEILAGGRRSIQVTDDGVGIAADEVELAFHRHTTSKLRTVEDLATVTSLGFRGEALAAIAAVCEVTVVTRTADQSAAVRLRLENGRVIERATVGAPIGTVLHAENLFHGLPARLKFLRSETTEAGHVLEVVSRYALAYPDRRFRLMRDGRLAYASSGSGALVDVVAGIYGAEVATLMLPLDDEAVEGQPADTGQPVRVQGLVGPPHLHRASRAHITVLVNGRWVQDASLATAVIHAYHTLIPTGRYPVAVLLLELPPDKVDVNVHPAKTQIRLREPQAVFSAVERAVRRAVTDAPTVAGWGGRSFIVPASQTRRSQRAPSKTEASVRDGRGYSPGAGYAEQAPLSSGDALPILRVIGQLGRMYIVAEGPEGLYIIDQHAAHERVLYERLGGRARPLDRQPLLMPEVVSLGPEELLVVTEHEAAFAALGFELEVFGPDAVILRAVPDGIPTVQLGTLLHNVIDGTREGSDAMALAFEERLIRAVCKQAAIKAGQLLDMTEMRELVRDLERCVSPATCPHGRPTRIVLDGQRLAREFRRT